MPVAMQAPGTMPAPVDFLFQYWNQALQAGLRATYMMEEARCAFLEVQIKALDDDIRGTCSAMSRASDATDWATFRPLPGEFIAEQMVRNSALTREFGKLCGETGASFVERWREVAGAWLRHQQGVLAEGGGYQPLSAAVSDFFEHLAEFAAIPRVTASKTEQATPQAA